MTLKKTINKRVSFIISLICAFTLCVASLAPVRLYASELTVEADLALNSKYLWRGLELNEDPVFQPEICIGYKGFSAAVWGNMELTDVYNDHGADGDTGDFTELDYIVDYSGSLSRFNYSVGAIYYDFPHTSFTDTLEIYVALGYDCLLSPTLTVYRDLRANDGYYVTAGISHDFDLQFFLNSTLSTSATVGCANRRMTRYYYGERKTAVTDALVSASLSIPVTKHIAIAPSVHYSALIDGGIRNENLGDKDDNLWCGITVSFSVGAF